MDKIRLSKSSIGEEEISAVAEVLKKEFLGMGDEVRLFEQELKDFTRTDMDVVCVNTGTAALHTAVAAICPCDGDEVLVPSLTYVASFQAVSASGAKPVACDIDRDTLLIDLKDAEKRITARTKAVMPVHYAGNCAKIDEVYKFAYKHGLRVIEDAAHSIGSERNGKPVGSEGDIICFSFDGIKNITSGEGGALFTSDKNVADFAKDFRLLGVQGDTNKRFSKERSWEFDVKHQGFRYHMSNIMAAIGRAQLGRIDEFRKTRQAVAKNYVRELSEIEIITTQDINFDEVIPHIFVIKVSGGHRDALRQELINNDIECGIHYYPNHLLSYFKSEYPLPAVSEAYEEILTLPVHNDLTAKQQSRVISVIKNYTERLDG